MGKATERTQGDLTDLESAKLGNKLVMIPSRSTAEELILKIIAIVTVHDSFIFGNIEFEECRLSLNR